MLRLEFELVIKENTNKNVYLETDEGYEIEVPLGEEQGEGTYDFLLNDISKDQLFVSVGEMVEFQDLWLNGEKLERGVDYTVVRGSTRVTINSQTFQEKGNAGANTIAAEFRVGGDTDNELKRSAQNFRLPDNFNNNNPGNGGSGSDSNGGSGSGDSGSSSVTATGNGAGETAAQANTVNLNLYLVDENDQPISGATVELHSTVRTGVTNARGLVTFANVEFGSHSITVKDSGGNVLATRSFVLTPGSAGVSGGTITATGGQTLSIRIRLADNQLSFLSVSVPQTSDSFNYTLCVVLLGISACGMAGMMVYRKKRKAERN